MPRGAAASGSLCCQQPKAAQEPAEPSGPPLAGARFLPAESPEQTGGLHSSKHDLAAPAPRLKAPERAGNGAGLVAGSRDPAGEGTEQDGVARVQRRDRRLSLIHI